MVPPAPASPRPLWSTFHVTLSAAGAAGLAWLSGAPVLFPALGASAVIVFSDPRAPASQPRRVVGAQVLGAVVGWLCLASAGVAGQARGLSVPLDGTHALTGVTSLALTTGLMRRLDLQHPAAAATTLIVGLGLLPRVEHVAVIAGSSLLLALHARWARRSLAA